MESNFGETDELFKNLQKLGIGNSTKKTETKKPATEKKLEEDISSDDDLEIEGEISEKDLDLKSLDELTKRIGKELGTTGFLSDSSDDEDEDEDEDDAEFRRQLMEEFQRMKSNESDVPKKRLKQIYLQLMKSGNSILKDKSVADQFLTKLNSEELAKLMEILQMDSDETIKFFNNDPEVIEVIKSTSSLIGGSKNSKGLWNELNDELLEEDEKELSLDEIKEKRENASSEVKRALKLFEENILHYSQNPNELLQLTQQLNSKDESLFLEIIFHQYTPEKMQEKLGMKPKEKEEKLKVEDLNEIMDADLVSHVFKEVLSHFKIYKKNPHKFDALTNRLNEFEKAQLDSLVKAFWDVKTENLKL
eukprot:gene2990-5000_t